MEKTGADKLCRSVPKSSTSWIWDQYLSKTWNGHLVIWNQYLLQTLKDCDPLKLRNFETKKPRSQATKEPRNQEPLQHTDSHPCTWPPLWIENYWADPLRPQTRSFQVPEQVPGIWDCTPKALLRVTCCMSVSAPHARNVLRKRTNYGLPGWWFMQARWSIAYPQMLPKMGVGQHVTQAAFKAVC